MSESDSLLPIKRPARVRHSTRSYPVQVGLLCFVTFLIISVIYLYDLDVSLQNKLQGLYDKTAQMVGDVKGDLTQLHSQILNGSSIVPTFGQLIGHRIDPKTIKYFKKQNAERKQLFQSHALTEYYNLLAPEVVCENMIRVGRLGDGGKWVCNPWKVTELDRKCVIYSLGLNNEISFDKEIQQMTGKKCDIVGVDVVPQNSYIDSEYKEMNGKIVITRINDVTSGTENMTIEDLLKLNKHSYIDLLKIDIEGTEYTIKDQLLAIPICQMMIEVHALDGHRARFYEFMHAASKAGFYLAHYEVNVGTMNAQELLFIHEKCLKEFGVSVKLGKFLD